MSSYDILCHPMTSDVILCHLMSMSSYVIFCHLVTSLTSYSHPQWILKDFQTFWPLTDSLTHLLTYLLTYTCESLKIAHFYLTLILNLSYGVSVILCKHFAWSNIYLYSLCTHVQLFSLLCTATWHQDGLRFVIQSQQSFKLAWLWLVH